MTRLNILFEGFLFVSNVDENNKINVTGEITNKVNKQMFFHMREVLISAIENGDYDIYIYDAIDKKQRVVSLCQI